MPHEIEDLGQFNLIPRLPTRTKVGVPGTLGMGTVVVVYDYDNAGPSRGIRKGGLIAPRHEEVDKFPLHPRKLYLVSLCSIKHRGEW